MKRVTVVHNAVAPTDGPDEQDVLVQAASVCEAVEGLGHAVGTLACTLDLDAIRQRLDALCPDVVFNLVESLHGKGRLIHLVPFLLDAMGIAYTGAPAEAVLVTSNKVMAKERMRVFDLPTAPWLGPYPEAVSGARRAFDDRVDETCWIIKSVWEHASLGIDEDGLLDGKGEDEILGLLRSRAGDLGGACFAERFIAGRELNLSVLAGPGGPEVLPPAEIIFEGYGEDRPRIVDYRAKWDDASFQFHHTPRRFDFPAEDGALLDAVRQLALSCWEVFGLKGYARVDFRVDDSGQPWILEVNANPCLSPDAGFAAALQQAGIPFAEAVGRILEDAMGAYR